MGAIENDLQNLLPIMITAMDFDANNPGRELGRKQDV
jgi:hypothetical protein